MLEKYKKIPSHWISDIHSYSMKELCQLKKLELISDIRSVVNDSVTHVSQCQVGTPVKGINVGFGWCAIFK